MKGLFYTTRNISGEAEKRYSHNQHIRIIEDQCSVVDLLSGTTTEKCRNFLNITIGSNIRKTVSVYRKLYENQYCKLNNWMEVYEAIDVSHLQDYDVLYIIGGLDLWRSNLNRHANRVGVFPLDRGQIKFVSTAIHLVHILALLKAHRELGKPLHELSFDPIEMNVGLFNPVVKPNDNYYLYHGYDIPKYNMRRLDSLPYYMSKRPASLESNPEKIFDFTFGYTILENSGRDCFEEFVTGFSEQFTNKNLFVKNYRTGENNLISRDAYLEKIAQSKYTLILPAYDQHCFSIYRIQESLNNNCLPIIHKQCNIADLQASFDVDLSSFVRDTPFATDSDRVEGLNYLKSKFLVLDRSFVR